MFPEAACEFALTWNFTDYSLLVPVRLSNPLLDAEYPRDGLVMAVVDTGFTGFLVVPRRVFDALKLSELKGTKTGGLLADGTTIELHGAYGVVRIPEIEYEIEGLIETSAGIREILLGVRGIEKLRVLVDGCRRALTLEAC